MGDHYEIDDDDDDDNGRAGRRQISRSMSIMMFGQPDCGRLINMPQVIIHYYLQVRDIQLKNNTAILWLGPTCSTSALAYLCVCLPVYLSVCFGFIRRLVPSLSSRTLQLGPTQQVTWNEFKRRNKTTTATSICLLHYQLARRQPASQPGRQLASNGVIIIFICHFEPLIIRNRQVDVALA